MSLLLLSETAPGSKGGADLPLSWPDFLFLFGMSALRWCEMSERVACRSVPAAEAPAIQADLNVSATI
jgi:hypothetical protein